MRKSGLFFFLSAVLSWSAFAATSEAGPPKVVLNPSGTGAGATGELKFKELAANGQHATGFKSPDALTADVMYTLPAADGTSGQALTTNGSKVLQWATVTIADGDKGDITVSGSGATFTIDNTAVTFAKVQNVTSDRLAGRDTAGSGALEELTVGGGLEFTGSGGIQRSALTGDVTASAGSGSTTIASNAVTTAKILDANVTLAKLESRARPTENILINGGMEIFQRGTANYDATSTAANLEGLYVGVDRWFWITNAGGVGTPSYTHKRVDCASEGSQYGLEVGHSGGSNTRYMCLSQIVEARDTIPLRGRTVRFQARVKQASSSATWKAVLINWTGTANTSIAKNLVNDWTSTTYTEGNFFTTNASYDIAAVGFDTSVGTSFTDVAVTGTVSSSANNLYVALFCITGNHTNAQVTKCGLYDGAEAREWLPRPMQQELALCQRYCYAFDASGYYIGQAYGYRESPNLYAFVNLPVPMRSATGSFFHNITAYTNGAPGTTQIAAYRPAAPGFYTLSGSLTVGGTLATTRTGYMFLTAGTSWSGSDGDISYFLIGPSVIAGFSSEL